MHFPEWLNAAILGIVEGLTEFLPISSTGHLIVTGRWLGFESEVFDIFIQLGALVAVWWLFRRRICRMIPFGPAAGAEGRRLLAMVVLAFLPAAMVGLLTHRWIKAHLFSTTSIAWASIVGGIVIFLVEGLKPRARVERVEDVTWQLALAVGLGQCLALCPGVSRSGATIMTGLAIGLSRPVATEFTFLLAVPTMTAAAFYELWKYRHDLDGAMVIELAVGFIAAYLAAWLVVKWFIRFVQNHTFNGFAWYRIAFGAALLALVAKGGLA
jgi:undecaprenyl-diphosphatase